MKIAQVLLSPRIGGAESLAASLEKNWNARGHDVETVYLDEHPPESALKRLVRLRRRLVRTRPDIVLSHSALPNLYARLALPRTALSIVVLHSASDDFVDIKLRAFERILLARTSAVIAVSTKQAAQYRKHFPKTMPVVISNGVDEDLPLRSDRSRANRAGVVTIARVADQKNPLLWMEVAGRLAQEQFQLQWFGPLSESGLSNRKQVEAFSRTHPDAFPGPTSSPGSVLAEADILFHPSDREANSVGLLEAAAVGLPIVCSEDVAATLPEFVRTLAFRTGDAAHAEERLREMAARFDEYADYSRLIAHRVRQDYGGEQVADCYLALFDESLTEASGASDG